MFSFPTWETLFIYLLLCRDWLNSEKTKENLVFGLDSESVKAQSPNLILGEAQPANLNYLYNLKAKLRIIVIVLARKV